MNRPASLAALAIVALSACDRPSAEPPAPVAPLVSSAPTTAPPPASSAAEPHAPPGATACGSFHCLQFESPEDAFRHVLTTNPVVLAVGESHVQKGKATVPSSAKRFTDTFLPFLRGKASDLVVELMAPNPSCKKTTKQVKKKHEVVTDQQAPTAQNEYVQMGERARSLGLVPDLLRPSCADLTAINDAGDDAVAATLSTIARLTTSQVEKILGPTGRKPEDTGKMVVTYGGVLHNDPAPSGARASWSYGPALAKATKDRYVALDLFVPEFIENTEVWRSLPWFAHYDADRLGDKTTLFRLEDGSFVLIFPRTDP